VLVLLLEPLAATQPGFWLSFVAVAALLAGFSGRLAPASRLELLWRPQWLVALALLAPLSLLAQAQAPLGPFVNAVAIPLVDLVVVPAALAGCLLLPLSEALSWLPLWLALRALELLWWFLSNAAGWSPPLPPRAGDVANWQLLLAAAGTAWLLLPRGVPARAVGLVLLLPLLWPARAPPPTLELLVLDVGQGTALIVRTAAHTLVYDAGPRYSERFDAGRALLAPALYSLGSTRVDRLVLSHADADHAGGAAGLMATLPVDAVLSGEAVAGVAAERCRRGVHWTWDEVRFEVLHPPSVAPRSGNDSSCVLRITAAGVRVLLAGDVEAIAEQALLRTAPGDLAAEVLLVPHHGSRSSSGAAFIDAVHPRIALVSAGYRNRFGHPHPEVVARYRARGVAPHETAREGAIRVTIDAAGNIGPVEGWRARERRFWYAAGGALAP
jgi:competence protein ComEC